MSPDISPKELPPQNIEAEKSLLGGLMLDSGAMVKVVDFLSEKTFIFHNTEKFTKRWRTCSNLVHRLIF